VMKFCCPLTVHHRTPPHTIQAVEVRYLILLPVGPHEPGHMDFCVIEIVALFDCVYRGVAIAPPLDWNGKPGKDEMARVARYVGNA